jgi:hypothetical protein
VRKENPGFLSWRCPITGVTFIAEKKVTNASEDYRQAVVREHAGIGTSGSSCQSSPAPKPSSTAGPSPAPTSSSVRLLARGESAEVRWPAAGALGAMDHHENRDGLGTSLMAKFQAASPPSQGEVVCLAVLK